MMLAASLGNSMRAFGLIITSALALRQSYKRKAPSSRMLRPFSSHPSSHILDIKGACCQRPCELLRLGNLGVLKHET